MNLDHDITQKIHIKIFLMRGQKKFVVIRTWFLSCSNIDEFQILAAWSRAQKKHINKFTEFSKYKGMKYIKLGHTISFYMLRKVFSPFFSKKILGPTKDIVVFESPLPCNGTFECSVHIFRGPWINL